MAIIFLAGLVIGLAIGRELPRRSGQIVGTSSGGFGQGSDTLVSTGKTDNLVGAVMEVKAKSLSFKTRVRVGDNLLIEEKEASVDGQTVIYGLTPKDKNDWFSADYNQKLVKLQADLKAATASKNKTAGQNILEQIRALTTEANAARNLEIKSLEQKLAGLKNDSQEKRDLAMKLAELSSSFKYRLIKLSDIQPNSAIQVWSNDDLASADKFKATKIEVRQ